MVKLLYLLVGGDFIDLSGVCEFGLWYIFIECIIWGFIEFCDYLGGCKFRDCKYLNDFGCLLRVVVEEGKINVEWFVSYYKILVIMDE